MPCLNYLCTSTFSLLFVVNLCLCCKLCRSLAYHQLHHYVVLLVVRVHEQVVFQLFAQAEQSHILQRSRLQQLLLTQILGLQLAHRLSI